MEAGVLCNVGSATFVALRQEFRLLLLCNVGSATLTPEWVSLAQEDVVLAQERVLLAQTNDLGTEVCPSRAEARLWRRQRCDHFAPLLLLARAGCLGTFWPSQTIASALSP